MDKPRAWCTRLARKLTWCTRLARYLTWCTRLACLRQSNAYPHAGRVRHKPYTHVALKTGWLTLLLCIGAVTAVAQETESADKPPRRDADTFFKIKYTRLAEEAFLAAATPVDPQWDEPTRLLHWVRAGNWKAVGSFLAQFEAEPARRIHAKICSDLSFARPEAMMLPEDVFALADASPVELEGKQITHVGGLLRSALKDKESRTEAMRILERGTRRLGGADEDRRRLTARVLAQAQLFEEARAFGLTDDELRAESGGGQTSSGAGPGWNQLLAKLRNSANDPESRTGLLDEMHLQLLESTPADVDKKLRAVLLSDTAPEVARLVFATIGRHTAAASRELDLTSRANHIELQHRAMQQLAVSVGFDDEPWQTMAGFAASNWLTEARNSHEKYPSWQKTTGARRDSHAHVPVGHLIQTAPTGRWLDAVTPQLATFVRITLVRLILFSEDINRAVPHIQALEQRDQPAAAELANAYLERWAQQHDPNLSPELLKEYKLDQQVIVLTRAQQEAGLAELEALLSSLDRRTRALLDETHLVRAFDFCHSRAEIHTRAHVEKVFGPIAEIPAGLAVLLVEQMRDKLALQWRELSVQRDAATRRTAADIFTLVNQGYAEATRTADDWLKSHPDAWRMECAAGSLCSDWGEFAYFQSVAADDGGDRFSQYLEHSNQARSHFRAGAAAYASLVPELNRTDFQLLPYRAWFHGLLGITHAGGVNLRKGVTDEGLQELRQAMLDLPGGAGDVHLKLFSEMVAENIEANRIAAEMKYRYLSSAVAVTGSRPTIYPAEEKVQYYDSLLDEIRLQARLDGSDRIRAPGEFGVFVSLIHTADVARESGGFDMYLMNQVQRTVSGKTITETPLYRDRFEEALRLALGSFFDVRTIAFADPTDGTRDLPSSPDAPQDDREWQETPLCYLLLATRDATVDRVPSLEIELDFFDRDGKVVLPVRSHPLQIEIAADAPVERPANNVVVTQIVDSRALADGLLTIDVSATADGLVPELDQLLGLSGYDLPIQQAVDQGGLQVKRLHNGPEGLYAESERSWQIRLDPTPLLRGAQERIDFEFPAARSAETEMVYRRYEDMDPVEAAAQVTLVEGDAAAGLGRFDYRYWVTGGASLMLALVCLAVVLFRHSKQDETQSPPLFSLPAELTPFSVIALLHRIHSSQAVALTEEQTRALQADVHALEHQTFARHNGSAESLNLEGIARRWLETALSG